MNSDASIRDLPPGDPKLTSLILSHLKSRGLFDELRRDCLGDVDTKPAYLNLKQRVDGYITKFLSSQTWTPDMNKNHVRDVMRREINESGMLSAGMDHLVDQIINPKIYHVFTPEVENGVRQFFGFDRAEVPTSHLTSTVQTNEHRISEALSSVENISTMAVSGAAPDIDEDTQDVGSAPSPKALRRPPSPCDIVSDVSSEPQLIIVTESNDRPEEDSEDPLPPPSPELGATRTCITTSSTTLLTPVSEPVAEPVSTFSSVTLSTSVTGSTAGLITTTVATPTVTGVTTSVITSTPAMKSSDEVAVPLLVVDVLEKARKGLDDKLKKQSDDREKEKSSKRMDDQKDDGAKKEKKAEKDRKPDKEKHDDLSRSESKSKSHGSSTSRKYSEPSSKSSKSSKARSEADTPKERKDSSHSSTCTTETKGDYSRDKGGSPKLESSQEKGDRGKHSLHSSSSSLKSSRSKESDSKGSKKKSDDRHRSQSSQHHDEKKHKREDDRSRDSQKSRGNESKHSSEKQRTSSKDMSKSQKTSTKSTEKTSERSFESSRESRKDKVQEKRHIDSKSDADDSGESKRRSESPRLTLWEGRGTSVQGEEILTFSYVKDQIDLKLISATCATEPSLCKTPVCELDDGLGFGSPDARLTEPEEGVAVAQEEGLSKIDSRTQAGRVEASGPVSKELKDSGRKSSKRRKSHASPRTGKRSPEKKRLKRNEDGNESEGAWSDVTVSSVHTSDLSSYDDRISLSSAEEEQEEEDSGAKEKVKISLKEIKKIASISSSNEEEDKLSKSETEHTEEGHKAVAADTTLPSDEKTLATLSSPAIPGCHDNDTTAEGKMGLRRQRKINPKYVSEEFSSIFTEGKKPVAGTIDFSELAKYGKERHYDERPRRTHHDTKANHDLRKQSMAREEVLLSPPVELQDQSELDVVQVTPTEGDFEASPEQGRRPSRRHSGSVKSSSPDGSEPRHRSESASSKRYDSSDLYKPRPVISAGKRRGRPGVQPPTSEEEPEEDEDADAMQGKKRPLKVCIGFKKYNKLPNSSVPPKKRRM